MNTADGWKLGMAALGLTAMLGLCPTGAWAQAGAVPIAQAQPVAAPIPDFAPPTSQAMRLYKLPLKDATPGFIVGKLSRVYYFGARPAGPVDSRGSGFRDAPFTGPPFGNGFGGANPPSGGGNPFGGASQAATTLRLDPSPLRLDGVRFLIDNERDNSLLIEATPEGFNALRAIVSALDVPMTARARHLAAKIAP